MEWAFTPEQVVKGEVDYGLADFRRDLAQELRLNLNYPNEGWFHEAYNLVYDLCHWLATGRTASAFLDTVPANAPLDHAALGAIQNYMADNVAMLGAILQRMIMDGVEAGLPLKDAVAAAAQRHCDIIKSTPLGGQADA
ncbi:MAG: hypothetical protein WC383_11565 [Gammaproteobacteria bacterium]